LALAKQSNVHRLGDDADRTHSLGNVNQAHAVIQDSRNVGIIEVGLFVVEGTEEVVIVLIDLRNDFTILDVEEANVARGAPVGIDVLS